MLLLFHDENLHGKMKDRFSFFFLEGERIFLEFSKTEINNKHLTGRLIV